MAAMALMAANESPSFAEALGMWLSGLLEAASMALFGFLYITVLLFIIYGTMYALSKLAGLFRKRRR